jgi:predicted nuclease of predicted toxin-antitoxin system
MLLFDHNLSSRLVQRLADLFPNATHVALVGLDTATDREVWDHAKANGLAITTKDSDFTDLSTLLGTPPKVVWLHIGNSSTNTIEEILRRNSIAIHEFLNDPHSSILEIVVTRQP